MDTQRFVRRARNTRGTVWSWPEVPWFITMDQAVLKKIISIKGPFDYVWYNKTLPVVRSKLRLVKHGTWSRSLVHTCTPTAHDIQSQMDWVTNINKVPQNTHILLDLNIWLTIHLEQICTAQTYTLDDQVIMGKS